MLQGSLEYTANMEEPSVNGIQASIIRQLLQHESMRFAELNVDNISSDQFSYHLRQLVKRSIVNKTGDNRYSLSNQGKGRAIMLSSRRDSFIAQAFVAVRVVLTKVEGGKEYFLLQRRVLVPYQGTIGTPGDKILFGETTQETAVRAMREQTGLLCDVQFKGVRHIMDVFESEIMQDKFFFVFSASNPRSKLAPSGPTGTNEWMTLDELKATGKSVQGGLEILDVAKGDRMSFEEVTYVVDSY